MRNEYNILKNVIMVEPIHMKITDIINEIQKKHIKDNIKRSIALAQHRSFSLALKQEGIEVTLLEAKETLNEQVFTRDIGFKIDNTLFISNLKEPIRKNEIDVLIEMVRKNKVSHYIMNSKIEGGDIILHKEYIYLGIGNRTSLTAFEELKNQLPDKQIIPIQLSVGILHLDCVFNIFDDNKALIYKDGLDESSFSFLEKNFHLIHITKDEQETMGTNILSIGNNKIFSLPTQKRINTLLMEHGFHVIEQPFSEIIKSGGSFRCCTLPIKRI